MAYLLIRRRVGELVNRAFRYTKIYSQFCSIFYMYFFKKLYYYFWNNYVHSWEEQRRKQSTKFEGLVHSHWFCLQPNIIKMVLLLNTTSVGERNWKLATD